MKIQEKLISIMHLTSNFGKTKNDAGRMLLWLKVYLIHRLILMTFNFHICLNFET
jgi:hypothetical protein